MQLFSDEYLEEAKKLSPSEIARFLDEYQRMHFASSETETIPISIRIPKNLLNIFRARCELENIPYQTKIKALMREWLA